MPVATWPARTQWVLTLPYPLRYRCAYDARLTSAVLRSFIRALFAELRRRSRRAWDIRAEQCGAVTFIQRFGSALNLNVHFHTLALDGAYTYTLGQGQAPRFLPLPPPNADAVARVLAGTARRIRRSLEERGGASDDLEIPCPLKPGAYDDEVWLFSADTGEPGGMDDLQSRMQGKIVVE